MDDRKRKFERAAPGDPIVKTALLSERLRSGEVKKDQLQLAAFLGDDSAQQVIGVERHPLAQIENRSELDHWAKSLTEQPLPGITERMIIASARAVLPVYQKWFAQRGGQDDRVSKAIEAYEDWVLNPSHTNQGRWMMAVELARGAVLEANGAAGVPTDQGGVPFVDASSASAAARAAITYAAPQYRNDDLRYIRPRQASFALENPRLGSGDEGDACRAMQKAIVDELLPWATGEVDPVKERVDARARARKAELLKAVQEHQADEARKKLDELS